MDILVIQLARLGDLLQTRRLLLSLEKEGSVHLCVDFSLAELAARIYPFAQIHAIFAHKQTLTPQEFLSQNMAAFAKLKKISFSAVYNLNYSPLNLALSTLFSPHTIKGHWLEKGQPLRSKWLDFAFRWSKNRRLAPLNLVDLWGLLAPNPLEPEKVNPVASPKGASIGLVLAGRMSRRSIPPASLATITAIIAQREKADKIYLLGTLSEAPLARELVAAMPIGFSATKGKVVDMCGKTNLLELAELVSNLGLVITPDTGIMHLAAFYGVPVEAFFLSSAWCFETGPYGLGHKVWQASKACLPCLESAPCAFNTMCLSPFTQKDFFNLLSATPEKRASMHPSENLKELLELSPFFDSLGVDYRPGAYQQGRLSLEETTRRKLLRQTIIEYCALSDHSASIKTASIKARVMAAQDFFEEKDWMLP